MTERPRRLPMLRAILNDWTVRQVDSFSGVVTLRLVTPDGQHITATFSDAQARATGLGLTMMADNVHLSRALGERNELACGCDVTEFDDHDLEHRADCPIRDTFV